MNYYHLIIEAKENLGKNDEVKDIHQYDIQDIQSLIPQVIRPYLTHTPLKVNDVYIPYEDITLFSIKQTKLPIQQLIEEEQRELPSNTDVTITAYEIFNDRDYTQDVTQVIIDLLDD